MHHLIARSLILAGLLAGGTAPLAAQRAERRPGARVDEMVRMLRCAVRIGHGSAPFSVSTGGQAAEQGLGPLRLRLVEGVRQRDGADVVVAPVLGHLGVDEEDDGHVDRLPGLQQLLPQVVLPLALAHLFLDFALQLLAALDRGDRLVILDVREPQEYQIARIDGSVLIPLGELPQRYAEIDKDQLVVCQCRSGIRSAKAAAFLRGVGFERVVNLTGGILRWSDEVDPSQPKY